LKAERMVVATAVLMVVMLVVGKVAMKAAY